MVFGTYVADYWEDGNWVDFSRVDISLKDLNKMLNVVFLIDEEDSHFGSLILMGSSLFPLFMIRILKIAMNLVGRKPSLRA